jgi:hypothetical protein
MLSTSERSLLLSFRTKVSIMVSTTSSVSVQGKSTSALGERGIRELKSLSGAADTVIKFAFPIPLQRHFSASTKFAHVKSRLCGRTQ